MIKFTGLHLFTSGTSNDREWNIDGEFEFDTIDDYEEFKACMRNAFEMSSGYAVPDIMTYDERDAFDALISEANSGDGEVQLEEV